MDNYVAIVFDSDSRAFDALHALWDLDARGDVTVHGAAVIHRDRYGAIDVATKDTDPGLRTALGVGIGALIGALAGPVGAVAAATAAGVGAAAGGAIGLTADAVKSGEREEAAYETGFTMRPGQAAVIAEVDEDWITPVDTTMSQFGGTVYRRPKGAVRNDSLWGSDYSDSLTPYDFHPSFA